MTSQIASFIRQISLVLILTLIWIIKPAYAFEPKPGSPMANRSHPRLHLTRDNIPDIRDALSKHYFDKYQQYVNWAANANDNDDTNVLYEAGHDPLRALMLHQALIAAIGPVPGINYPVSLETYAGRAINRLSSQLNAGQKISYVAAITYDWTFNYMSESQRRDIAEKLSKRTITHKVFDHSVTNPNIAPEQMFSSKYYEGCYAWYIGLALWGDGYVDAAADKAVDSFYDVMLNFGYLDAHNFVAGDEGGWSEWIGYSAWHPRTHMINIDGWSSATGENMIAGTGTTGGNAIKNYPKFIAYMVDPFKYFNDGYTYVRLGGAETTDCSFQYRSVREQMHMLPFILARAGLDQEAGLMTHIIDRYEVAFGSYEHHYIYSWLGLAKAFTQYTPRQLNLPNYQWSENLGVFAARTGFESEADGVFTVEDSHYRFEGHNGLDDFPGFTLAKFGTLINTRNVAHRGYGNLSDYPGGFAMNIVYFDGGHGNSRSSMEKPAELEQAWRGSSAYDHGGIEQVTAVDGSFYHVYVDRSRQFESGVRHTRDFVYLPGGSPNDDSDFLVVYDRTEAPSQPQWVYHVPWKPAASNYSSTRDLKSGSGESGRIGDGYYGNDIIIKELNGIGGERDSEGGKQSYVGGAGAHGVAFVKTLLPEQADVEVTRVASFDKDVIKRQHHLAIKSHRWQVAVKPQAQGNSHRFLHVFQAADAGKVNEMTTCLTVNSGTAMQGVWIEKEGQNRPNYVVLFNKEFTNHYNAINYSLSGAGNTRHVIVGVEPYAVFEVKDQSSSGTTTRQVNAVRNMQLWDYKGIQENQPKGVLFFETSLTGDHTFVISKVGQQDVTPPSKPRRLKIKSN